ncbi:DUF4266 domain-containing protein [Psychrobium sp. 1_MG-2023]|uniref:DUF4266 domain-containing protein n=1 Tax=Psychrobium sp. 1_MG-2023 TaxID=3062624 RepID=UPI000C31EF9F|nr:DUF4266 domain-containing protein [Psychrobium sp. 1_MG-2023]MDP2562860.1 DUF4266 domain-containing protein [Psychrobium sp. 1_MG-2023]PKF53974.1 hypothetical protein CW748_17380 [Alteromonadales bacterium alter-6D02]
MSKSLNTRLKSFLVVLVLPTLFACQNTLKPWVKPYERNNLTLAVMDWELDPIANGYRHHVYQAREGARGAEGGSGGGCGCN